MWMAGESFNAGRSRPDAASNTATSQTICLDVRVDIHIILLSL
jgi:hypothetical protein